MKTLKNQCHILQPKMELHPNYNTLSIHFKIRLEEEVCALWNGQAGRIKAHVLVYGDDGNKGDEFLYQHEYPLKLSYNGQSTLEEDTHIPVQNKSTLLNEDKKGRDEIYTLFYLTMTLETTTGHTADAMISEIVRTEKVIGSF